MIPGRSPRVPITSSIVVNAIFNLSEPLQEKRPQTKNGEAPRNQSSQKLYFIQLHSLTSNGHIIHTKGLAFCCNPRIRTPTTPKPPQVSPTPADKCCSRASNFSDLEGWLQRVKCWKGWSIFQPSISSKHSWVFRDVITFFSIRKLISTYLESPRTPTPPRMTILQVPWRLPCRNRHRAQGHRLGKQLSWEVCPLRKGPFY